MKIRATSLALASALTLCAGASAAVASPGTGHPMHPATPTHSSQAAHSNPSASNAKAYGRYCASESHKRADAAAGTSGTPFSQCVTALAHAHTAIAAGKALAPGRACAAQGLSRKHVSGTSGTPFSACVAGMRRMEKAASAS
jgi:hypothetical protein